MNCTLGGKNEEIGGLGNLTRPIEWLISDHPGLGAQECLAEFIRQPRGNFSRVWGTWGLRGLCWGPQDSSGGSDLESSLNPRRAEGKKEGRHD